PHEKLYGKIIQALGIRLLVPFLCFQQPVYQLVPNGQGHGQEQITARKTVPCFSQRVSDMLVNRFLQGGDGVSQIIVFFARHSLGPHFIKEKIVGSNTKTSRFPPCGSILSSCYCNPALHRGLVFEGQGVITARATATSVKNTA